MDGDRGLTELLLYVIPDLEYYNLVGGIGTAEQYELAWSQAGYCLESLIDNKGNLGLLVDYLKAEFHAKHDIDPQIQKLRELLGSALKVADKVRPDTSVPAELRRNIIMLGYKCSDWIGWIDRYFPPEQSTQEQDNEEPVKQDELPNKMNTEKAKKYFPRAEKAGYIDGHKWIGDNVRLGYFCSKVYSHPRPINDLEDYFGVKKLSASISQAELEPKRSDVIEWRKEIDDSIFYD